MTLTAQELYQRGTALVCAGRYAEAIAWFDRALERNPRNKEVLVALAAAVDRLGLFQEAVLSCDQALEIDDQYPDAWFVKGLALFRLSQYTESGSCFQMLVEMDHSHAEAWFMKGNCHYHLGEFTDCDPLLRRDDPDPQEISKSSLQYGRCPCRNRTV